MANDKKRIGKGRAFLLAICIIIFLFSASLVIKHFVEINDNKKGYEDLSALVTNTTAENGDTEDDNVPDYSALIEQNRDFVGWIKVPNTEINHPVVQYVDNDYYLDHSFEKKYDYRGAIFMDYRNDPVNLDSNTIIYGHNAYDTTMFSELVQYEDIEFYKKAPVFEFNTVEGNYKWKIYGVFITNATASEDNGYIFNYIYPYMDGENFNGFIEEIDKRRLYTTDVDITDDDKMLILSTCVRTLDYRYKDENGKNKYYRANARLVVLARMVRDGESAEVNVDNAQVNKNPKYPQLWYDKKGLTNPYKNDEKWSPQEVVQNEQ